MTRDNYSCLEMTLDIVAVRKIRSFNPLTAGADYIRGFLSLSGQPAFERVKEKTIHQSAIYKNS